MLFQNFLATVIAMLLAVSGALTHQAADFTDALGSILAPQPSLQVQRPPIWESAAAAASQTAAAAQATAITSETSATTTATATSSAQSQSTPTIVQNITQPVIERVVDPDGGRLQRRIANRPHRRPQLICK